MRGSLGFAERMRAGRSLLPLCWKSLEGHGKETRRGIRWFQGDDPACAAANPYDKPAVETRHRRRRSKAP